MRLFSKVKPGAAFVEAESSIRSQQETRAEEAEQEAEENVRQLKVTQQAASAAVDYTFVLRSAQQATHAAQRYIAELWTDGSLGDVEGLPNRKTRIYIGSDMARPHGVIASSVTTHAAAICSAKAAHAAGTDTDLPLKKKRKGKSERNRLKKLQEQAVSSGAPVE